MNLSRSWLHDILSSGIGPSRASLHCVHAGREHAIDPRLSALRAAFAAHEREQAKAPSREANPATAGNLARASVALVVRPHASDLELLVIRRATRSGDPWSGHMALPGGRQSEADASSRMTAERETHEEVGIDLSAHGEFLGRLNEVWPRTGAPAIVVAPFAFYVPSDTETTLNHEVDQAFWIPVRQLAAADAATEYLLAPAGGEELRFPAIAYEAHVIWGLTHGIMTEFLDIARAASPGEQTP